MQSLSIMLSRLPLRLSILIFILLMPYSLLVEALPVEAEGRALIRNQSIEAARDEALRNASQQALLQAGAHVSATQSISQGVLNVDNVRIRSNGQLTDIKIIDERVSGDQFIVRISAEVVTEGSCASGGADYLKRAGIAAFVIEHPQQANLGDLHNAPSLISQRISQELASKGHLNAINAGHLSIGPVTPAASGYQQSQGPLTDSLSVFADLDVQFIVSGVIRDLSKYDASRSSEGNAFIGLYDKMDYRGQQHMRNFAIDVFIHDGYTGALLSNKQYRTGGLWRLDDHVKTGFASAAFLKTDYGQQVNKLLSQITQDIDKTLRCEPFRARIISTEGNLVTFNAGTLAGIRPGDKMTVYRKSIFYDQLQQPHVRLENTRHTLVVNEVHPQFGVGRVDANTEQENIQQDDVLLAW